MFEMTSGELFLWCLKIGAYGLAFFVIYGSIALLDSIIERWMAKATGFCHFKQNEATDSFTNKIKVTAKYTWMTMVYLAIVFPISILIYELLDKSPVKPLYLALAAMTLMLAVALPFMFKKAKSWTDFPILESALMFAGFWYELMRGELPVFITGALLMVSIGLALYTLRYALIERVQMDKVRSTEGGESASQPNHQAKHARYSFKDVAGMEDLKKSMLKAGMEIIGKSKSVHGKVKNGILFFGLPGNGKTFFAEALAGELKIKFLAASFGDMASMWVGETTQRAMKIFDDAEAQAPCMLFLDEIDSVFVDRGSVKNADSEAPKTLNAILTRLVDIRNKGVVVVGATNYLEKLDTASIREGRFDYKIEVKNPDYEARKALLQRGLKGLSVSNDVLESVATRWEGYSVSRIMSIADKAKENVYENSQNSVGFDDLMKALRDVQGSKGDNIPESVPTVDKLFLTEAMRHRMNNIIERMKHIDQIEKFGGNAPTGILLSGPPGTGKTLGAMVLAKTCGWSFIQTTGNTLIGNPDEIDKLMQLASDIRPCVLFIDEADDVLADRNGSMSKSVTNRLLSVMDGAKGKPKDVLFVAATNYPDLIDDAMLRGGRFTEKIEFSLPDLSVLRDYIAKWIEESKAPLSHDFTVENVSQMLRGQSLANVKVILQGSINESITRLSSDANATVGLDDVESAMQLIAS